MVVALLVTAAIISPPATAGRTIERSRITHRRRNCIRHLRKAAMSTAPGVYQGKPAKVNQIDVRDGRRLDEDRMAALEAPMSFRQGIPLAGVLAVVLAAGCGGGGHAVNDETIGQRVIEYFGKAVTTPGVTFKMTKIEPAEMPGWRKGHIEAALGDQKQDVLFYVSDDGRYLFRGEAIDLTVDPFK